MTQESQEWLETDEAIEAIVFLGVFMVGAWMLGILDTDVIRFTTMCVSTRPLV